MSALKGGEKVLKAIKHIEERVAKGGHVRVGFLEGATYPNGLPVAAVASYNEFGVPSHNQPPRPFFRTMIAEKSPEWGPELGQVLKATDYNVDRSLGLMGERIQGQLQDSIRDLKTPPLSPVTIARKGFDKPLIDTGHMLASVGYDVETK